MFLLSRRRLRLELIPRARRRLRHAPAIASSLPLTLLKSTFQAYAAAFPAPDDRDALPALLAHLRSLNSRLKRATHCMYAFRSSSLSRAFDGGEAGAGDKLSCLLERGHHQDVIVVVYRWYGGVQLGSARWRCILRVAAEALKAGGFANDEEHAPETKAAAGKIPKKRKK